MNYSADDKKKIDKLLEAARDGNAEAMNKLMPFIYDELRRRAHKMISRERPGHTLQTTELVHEAYTHLAGSPFQDWENQEHFLNFAAKIMRNVLVGHARRRHRPKHGGDLRQEVELEDIPNTSEAEDDDLIRLDEALTKLARLNQRQAKIVEKRFFAGLTNEATAEVMNISVRTVKREWRYAKTWLRREMNR